MNRALGYVAVAILIWYIAFVYGCIMEHQPDEASLKNPPTTDELERSILAVRCLIPAPTVTGVAIAVAVTLATGYLGGRV